MPAAPGSLAPAPPPHTGQVWQCRRWVLQPSGLANVQHAGVLRPLRSGCIVHSRAAWMPCHSSAGVDASAPLEDAGLRVKLMLAESSGRLDLSECGLTTVPLAVFDLVGLEELSLAGNNLASLPPEIGRLTALQRLQLSGNLLRELPPEVGALHSLQGLWLHGNRLHALPAGVSAMQQLTQLSLSGNNLEELPEQIGALAALRDLSVAGNSLRSLPSGIGRLSSLVKLSLHGNQLQALPAAISGLVALKELWVQGNPRLSFLPPEIGVLPALEHLSVADCALAAVPSALGRAPVLRTLSLYGNNLHSLPAEVLDAPALESVWVEGNPLLPGCVADLLKGVLAAGRKFKCLGLARQQLAAVPADLVAAVGSRLQVSDVVGEGPGYFKLERAPSSPSSSAPPQVDVLVVAFGSAPGVPNWGGLVRRIREAVSNPRHNDFDVLYVVDPHRAWFGGGDDASFATYYDRLRSVSQQYSQVVMVGDSMGATATLMFAPLATTVQAFCPQVKLAAASIRPAEEEQWHEALRQRVLHGVASCPGRVVVHVGCFQHDLDQVNALPTGEAVVRVYSVNSHRLALALDRGGTLLSTMQSVILNEMGETGHVRLANLL